MIRVNFIFSRSASAYANATFRLSFYVFRLLLASVHPRPPACSDFGATIDFFRSQARHCFSTFLISSPRSSCVFLSAWRRASICVVLRSSSARRRLRLLLHAIYGPLRPLQRRPVMEPSAPSRRRLFLVEAGVGSSSRRLISLPIPCVSISRARASCSARRRASSCSDFGFLFLSTEFHRALSLSL